MNMKNFVFGSLLVFTMTACGPENKNIKEYDHDTNTILWENVGSEFNPQVSQNDMDVKDVTKIIVNVPAAADKVSVVYSPNLPADTAVTKIYTISKDSVTSSGLRRGRLNNTIEMADQSQSCNFKAEDGRIKYLKGYCYARIEVHMREGSQIEVYSGGKILTTHFQTISLVELMARMQESHDDAARLENVADFAASYSETSQRAKIYVSDLTAILRQFKATAPKMQTLRLLHIYVTLKADTATAPAAAASVAPVKPAVVAKGSKSASAKSSVVASAAISKGRKPASVSDTSEPSKKGCASKKKDGKTAKNAKCLIRAKS